MENWENSQILQQNLFNFNLHRFLKISNTRKKND